MLTCVTYAPRAFRNPVAPATCIAIGGIAAGFVLGSFDVIDDLGIIGFLLGGVASTLPFWIFGKELVMKIDAENTAEDQAIKIKNIIIEQNIIESETRKNEWIKSQKEFNYSNTGYIFGRKTTVKCVLLVEKNWKCLRIIEYNDQDGKFQIFEDYLISLGDIISLDVLRPKNQKTIYESQFVSIVEKEQRSPVGRAVVGGILLGPLGAVVGGASGLGGKLSTNVEERKVAKTIIVDGKAQLVIGTSSSLRAVLHIQFDPDSGAVDLMYQIRAAQARS